MIHDFENFNKLNEGISNSKGVILVVLDGEPMKVYSYDTIEEANEKAELLVRWLMKATGKDIDRNAFGERREGFCYYLKDIVDTDFECDNGYITSSACDDFSKDFKKLLDFAREKGKRNSRSIG